MPVNVQIQEFERNTICQYLETFTFHSEGMPALATQGSSAINSLV